MILYAFAIIAIVIATVILYARWHYGTLEALGVPVVPPKFIFGSDPGMHKLVLHEEDKKRAKKYGRFWGAYEGRDPHLFVVDPDILRCIMLKDFDHFRDRRHLDFGHDLFFETLDVLPYAPWKAVRTALTPSFTTGKLKLMSETMQEVADCCMKNLEKNCGKADSVAMNAKQIFIAVAADVIARCAFGMKIDSLNDPSSPFVKNLTILTQGGDDPNFMLTAVLTFPILARAAPIFPTDVIEYFGNILRKVMAERRQAGIVTQDDMVYVFSELHEKTNTPEFKQLGITEQTVVAQALVFLFAGYETLATTMTMLCYQLAMNPDKQEKLAVEIDSFWAASGEHIDYDKLRELPYLDACLSETLRITPPFIRSERVCEKDWKHEESGLAIKKGTVVMIPAHAVHNNEKYWPEPEKFIPERFLPENKDNINQYAFLPFGAGPRNCIGSRFAKQEMVLVMAKLLKEFSVDTTPETKIVYRPGRQFVVQYDPLMLRFCRRK